MDDVIYMLFVIMLWIAACVAIYLGLIALFIWGTNLHRYDIAIMAICLIFLGINLIRSAK